MLRAAFGVLTAAAIASLLPGRSADKVRTRLKRIGLKYGPTAKKTPVNWREVLAERLGQHWSDSEIAAEWGCTRRHIGNLRRAIGLPASGNSERRRAKVATRTREQCRAAGVTSLGGLRSQVLGRLGPSHGWPVGLRARSIHILELLYAAWPVPLSRREIADGIGMPWKGVRKSLTSNDPEGSYLAHLAALGLVIRSPRTAPVGINKRGNGQGCGVSLYTLTAFARDLKQTFLHKGQSNGETSTVNLTDATADSHRVADSGEAAKNDRGETQRRIARKDRRSLHSKSV